MLEILVSHSPDGPPKKDQRLTEINNKTKENFTSSCISGVMLGSFSPPTLTVQVGTLDAAGNKKKTKLAIFKH